MSCLVRAFAARQNNETDLVYLRENGYTFRRSNFASYSFASFLIKNELSKEKVLPRSSFFLVTQQAHNVIMTSMRLDDVAPTSTRRYFDVICLLGKGKLYFGRAVSSREELSHVDKKTQGKTWLLVAFDQGSQRNLSQATTFGFFRRFHCTLIMTS